MEQMIDKNLIKKHRKGRSWSQDQLASISGLSLRTVQRIENKGSCSLESKKALAAALEIDATSLDLNLVSADFLASNNRGRKFGFAGAVVGLVGAYAGISLSLALGNISPGQAGLYYGGVGAFCGICCAIIGVLSNRYKTSAA